MAIEELYTPKQRDIMRFTNNNHEWFILLNHGAIRSGKTVLDNDLFLKEVRAVRRRADEMHVATPLYILAGFSGATIEDNVLTELSNKYGFEFKYDKYGNFMLFGVKILRCAHGTIKGLGSIRGKTCWGAYINEASLAHPQVFTEITFRCSAPGARIIGDTNPDHPEHWLKKDYIDKPTKRIVNFHFTLDDNAFLDEQYVESIKASTPSGMLYDRGILGQWVSGDGVVYKDFSEKTMNVPRERMPWPFERMFVGVDWGWEHHGSMIVIGVKNASYYIVEEFSGQYIDIGEWVQYAHLIYQRYGNIPFYCDSARPDNVSALNNASFNAVNANKNIIPGIEAVSYAMKNGRFFIDYNACERFRQEIYSYTWNKKLGLPNKELDDTQDAIRYGIYSDIIVQSRYNRKYYDIIKTMNYVGLAR